MIDIHSHILPDLDDGAQSIEESIAMGRTAVDNGITTVVATPHYRKGVFENEKAEIINQVKTLNTIFKNEWIPLTVIPGQEIRIFDGIVQALQTEIIMPINESRYVLIEFPHHYVPHGAGRLLLELQTAGYTPIIAHPERNYELIANPGKLYEFVKKGALSQLTAASLLGTFGASIQTFSNQLIEANLTHFIASDAHNGTTRPFMMEAAINHLEENYGTEIMYLFLENSQFLIDNANVNRLEPERIKKKRFLGLF